MRLVWTQGKIVKSCCSKSNKYRISCSEKEITDEKQINTELSKFYKALFKPKINLSNALIQDYLDRIEIPKLTQEQSQKCDGETTEEEMPTNKSPGNDGITKEFYEAFWDDLNVSLLLSVNKAFEVGELSTPQKQAVILVSKVLPKCLKTAFPSLISSNQIEYLNGRFIVEGRRLISDISEVSDLLKLEGLLLTVILKKLFILYIIIFFY